MDKQQCSVMVMGEGSWGAFHQHKCRRPATIERDNKWYCKIHDPEYIKAKSAERTAIFENRRDKDHAAFQRRNVLLRIAEGIDTAHLERHADKIHEFIYNLRG